MVKEYDRDSMSWDGKAETLKPGMMVRVVEHLEDLYALHDVAEQMFQYAGKVSEVLHVDDVELSEEGEEWDSSPYIYLVIDSAEWTWRLNFIEPVNEAIKREVKENLDKLD